MLRLICILIMLSFFVPINGDLLAGTKKPEKVLVLFPGGSDPIRTLRVSLVSFNEDGTVLNEKLIAEGVKPMSCTWIARIVINALYNRWDEYPDTWNGPPVEGDFTEADCVEIW